MIAFPNYAKPLADGTRVIRVKLRVEGPDGLVDDPSFKVLEGEEMVGYTWEQWVKAIEERIGLILE